MKKWFFLLLAPVFIFSSCKKNSGCAATAPGTVASAAETAYLQNYLTANSITAASTHGMFYNITGSGSGALPNLCSTITVTYTGKLITGTTDGAQFDASLSPVNFNLDVLIAGWQLVLPLVKTNGTVTLYIPPSFGYGATAAGSIPANSYLKFDITLVSTN